MRTRLILILLLSLLFAGQVFAAGGSELQVRASKPGNIVTVEREIDDGKVLLSVSDADKKPVFGLTRQDGLHPEA